MSRPFLPLPSNFDLGGKDAVGELNKALRRIADQIPAPTSAAPAVRAEPAAVVPRCGVHNSTDQSVTSATFTALSWDTNDYDAGGIHSTSVNPTRFTAPEDGYYLVTAYAAFQANAVGQRQIVLRLNGASYLEGENGVPLAATVKRAISAVVALSAGDYLEVVVYQDSGGILSVYGTATAGTAASRAHVHKLP